MLTMVRKARKDLITQYYKLAQPASYTSQTKLEKVYHGKRNVKDWLKNQKTQQLHKPIKLNFRRVYTYAPNVDYLWQIDLTFLRDLKHFNKGNEYLLACIDVFSKYAWVIPIKNKSAESVLEAFKIILSKGRKPLKIQSDKGTEFENHLFQKFLKKNNIHFYTSKNYDIKAAVVERFNRTLKIKMYKYFTTKKTKKYINILDSLVSSYNNTYHRSIGMTPNKASQITSSKERLKIFNRLYPVREKDRNILKKGDRVRVSKLRKTFRKGYLANWSEEIFTIYRVFNTTPSLYQLIDRNREKIDGRFYFNELQKV